MYKKILISVLVAIAVLMGFLRDHVFVSINQLIETEGDAEHKLSLLKWVLTLLFSLLYLLNTWVLMIVLFRPAQGQPAGRDGLYIRIAVYSYIFLFVVSILAAGAGYIFSAFENIYPFIRTVMGIAQSPVPMMILIPACFLNEAMLKKSAK
jgi:hypothetical protein